MVAPAGSGTESLGPVARISAGVSINDVDDELETLMTRAVNADRPGGNRVRVDFEAPTKDWRSGGGQTPRINAYLYDIRQDPLRKEWGRVDVKERDERAGKPVVQRRVDIPRWFRLSYLLTAWATSPVDEHDVLTKLLRAFIARDTLPLGPDPDVSGRTEDPRLHLPIALGMPPPQDRAISDVWSAMGVEQKPSLDLMVSIPVMPADKELVGALTTLPPRLVFGRLLPQDPSPDSRDGDDEAAPATGTPGAENPSPTDGWRRRVRQGVVPRRETTHADERGGRPIGEEHADRQRAGGAPED